jgi:hypothetical protein
VGHEPTDDSAARRSAFAAGASPSSIQPTTTVPRSTGVGYPSTRAGASSVRAMSGTC